MSAWGWAIVENIALLAAMCFLVWHTDSAWWALLLIFLNYRTTKEKANEATDTTKETQGR